MEQLSRVTQAEPGSGYLPGRAGQHDHRSKTPGELVVASADSPVLFQPAKHPLDDIPLAIFRTIKQPGQSWLGFALHGAPQNHRLLR